MALQEVVNVAAQLSQIQAADDRLPADDRHKLAPWLRQQVNDDFAALTKSDSVTATTEVERSGKSDELRILLEQMELLVRDGYNGIGAIRYTHITEAERKAVYAAYGWTDGLLGRLTEDRIVSLARMGILQPTQVAASHRYSAGLVSDLKKALVAYDKMVPASATGPREAAVQVRNLKLEAAEQTLAQVRYWYFAASRETVKNPELHKIGFQPRRKARTKDTIEAATKRTDEKRAERERKQLQRIAEDEQSTLARLSEAMEKARAKAARARGELSISSGERESASAESVSDGDVSLSA